MKQILTTLLLLFSLTISAQTTVVTGPKKKQQTTTPAKQKQQASQPKQQKQQAAKPKQQPKQQQAASKQKPTAPASKPQPKQPSIIVSSGYENGHEWVDLGLSVKWATTNVGASSLTDYGSYFAWGETRTKSDYSWSTYFDTNDGGSTFFKYARNKKATLDLSDDAAHANWGGSWRMPTRAEQDELREKCTWTWTIQSGAKGYKVSSKRNGNSIFLPAAGYRYNGSLYDASSGGSFWSSSLTPNNSNEAYGLYLDSGKIGWYYYNRSYGRSVRAVCP